MKRIHKWKPFTGKPAGRPKCQWDVDECNDLKKMKIVKWVQQVRDQLKLKDNVERDKNVSEL